MSKHKGPASRIDLLVVGVCLTAIGLVGAVIGVGWFAPGHAASVQLNQPYGGCKEGWQAPHSPGARDCRHLGWTIKHRLVVTPRGVVTLTRLPHCREEDGSGQRSACTWNIGRPADGDGRGASLWIDERDRFHYVWERSPLVPGWHWSNRHQSHAMGRRDCIVRNGTTVASGLIARCPG